MSLAQVIADVIMNHGLELFKRYYGWYDFRVTSNKDPQGRGRVQGYCPYIGQRESPGDWVLPVFLMGGAKRKDGKIVEGGQYGFFWPPEEGDVVLVSFANGDPDQPSRFIGGNFGQDKAGGTETPKEFRHAQDASPMVRGWVTPGGHRVTFDDKEGAKTVKIEHASGTYFEMGESGIVQWKTPDGAAVFIDPANGSAGIADANGNVATLDSTGITLKEKAGAMLKLAGGQVMISAATALSLGAGAAGMVFKTLMLDLVSGADQHAVRGEDLIAYIAGHAHSTGMGPSGPPIVPPSPALLSQGVKLK